MSERISRRVLSPEQDQEVAARYLAGATSTQLAAEYGVSAGAMLNAIQRGGAALRPKKRTVGELGKAEKIRRDYESGLSLREVGELHEMSIHHAKQAVLYAGGAIRKGGGFSGKPRHGSENWAWKGGRRLNAYGYMTVWIAPDDSLASMRLAGKGYVLEHRLVMARSLGRPLTRTETVHHINGIKTDNRLENLQLRAGHHGPGVRHRCLDCGSENVEPVAL